MGLWGVIGLGVGGSRGYRFGWMGERRKRREGRGKCGLVECGQVELSTLLYPTTGGRISTIGRLNGKVQPTMLNSTFLLVCTRVDKS